MVSWKDSAARKRALRSLVLRICFSLVIIAGGYLFPAYLRKHDADIRSDDDFRAGAVLPLCLFGGIGYAALAVWRFYCAQDDYPYFK
jgi:hypothetical protein